MKKKVTINPNRVTLYMTNERREQIAQVAKKLKAEGYPDAYKDNGSVNVSAIVAKLIEKYLTPQ